MTFYNGMEPMEEDEVILKLSDAFEVPTDHPELEVAVRVLNINPGHNAALLESCITLKQYMEFVTKVRECIDILTAKTIDNPLPYTDRLRIAISEAVDYCVAHDILGDFLKKHRSEVIAVTLYEYSEEEHRRIQERDKAELKEQLAEAETNLRQSNAELQQSKDKLSQSIHNTIAMLQSMGCDDSFICAKLCEIYQISETSAMTYLQK